MNIGEIIHGFEFISAREIPEIEGTVYEAVYTKNRAKLLFIDRADSNKTFAIAFKTIPTDDTGVFHIIEHSVLCGSDKYPVKEPFVELLKGSVKTFLNAFTFPDKTMYPVSSRNDKDFLNLIDVYMDAVLHPVAVTKPEIFYQEGWHHELHSRDDEMIYKGVVFNEMKGAYSSADEVMMSKMATMLYKNSCYGKDSGGDPTAIPNLTYEQFIESHRKYYHPSNSRIILDGAVDLDKTLALLDSYLSEYEYLEVDSDIPMMEPMGHTCETVEYEIGAAEDEEGKVRICLGFYVSDYTDRRTPVALAVICDAIAGSNEAPFKKAILDSGLCEDVQFIPYDGIQQNSVLIELRNVKRENAEALRDLCMAELKRLADNGINRSALSASFNSLEFKVRERESQGLPLGISYAIAALDSWLYGGDPTITLSFEEDIAYLRSMLEGDYYESVIRSIFLESKHSAELYMIPSKTLGEDKIAKEKARLAKEYSAMTEDEIDKVIERTLAIEAWQQSEDTPEALATLPSLAISDIDAEPENFVYELDEAEGVEALYIKAATRGISYTTLAFDISDFDEEELFLTSMLTALFNNLPTKRSDTVTLQTRIKSELGSFTTVTPVYTRGGKVYPYLSVVISALDSKLERAVEIASEVLLETLFADEAAVGKIIKQIKNMTAEGIAASGHGVAFSRSAAFVSAEAAVIEYLDGVENYLRVKELDAAYSEKSAEFMKKLAAVRDKIFSKKRLTLIHTGERNDEYSKKLVGVFPDVGDKPDGSNIKPFGKANEALIVPSGVAYAAKAGSVLNYEERMSGSMTVIRSILSFGYLWNVIRVQGGAYGAGFIKRNNGVCGYYTYRDPDPARSADCFEGSPDFLRGLASDGGDITDFIIGAVGDSDPLITPRSLHGTVSALYFMGKTYEDRRRARREMIQTSHRDLLHAADLIEKMMQDAGICVVCGKDKLAELGDKIERIIEI